MVKNESQRIKITLDSVKKCVDKFIVMDTGSDDNTIEVIKKYSNENNIHLDIFSSKFVDFSTSRNELLDYSDDKADWLLLMDANDELQEPEKVRYTIKNYNGNKNAFMVKQKWKTFTEIDTYFNIRIIKTKNNWRYKQPVHEYIYSPIGSVLKIEDIVIFQDRTKDDDKSFKRFIRDKKILEDAIKKDPKDSRCLFYLGQTLYCLGEYEKSFESYKKTSEISNWDEEKYTSLFRCGMCAKRMNCPSEDIITIFLKAYDYSGVVYDYPRIEPLIEISKIYGEEKRYHMSYLFLKTALELKEPKNCQLFLNFNCYRYIRYHLMGCYCYYLGNEYRKLGMECCLKAIEVENNNMDKNNLKMYCNDDVEYNKLISSIGNKEEKEIKIDVIKLMIR